MALSRSYTLNRHKDVERPNRRVTITPERGAAKVSNTDLLSLSEIESGLKFATESLLYGDARGVNPEPCRVDRWSWCVMRDSSAGPALDSVSANQGSAERAAPAQSMVGCWRAQAARR